MSLEVKKSFTPVISEIVQPENRDRFIALAGAFHDQVVFTGRFSWLGLVEVTDQLKRPRLAVYLTERAEGVYDSSYPRQNISETLVPLALACSKKDTFLDLYHLDGVASDQTSADRVVTDAKGRYQDSEAKCLYEEIILGAQERRTQALSHLYQQIQKAGVLGSVSRIELYDPNRDGENPCLVRLKTDFQPREFKEGSDLVEKIHRAEIDTGREFHPLPWRFAVMFEDVRPTPEGIKRFFGTTEMPEPLMIILGKEQ